MKPTLIYVLRDPRDGAVRYVGKTVQSVEARLAAHIRRSKAKKTHRDCWITGLLALGLRPSVEVIESVPAEAYWQARERHWIAHFKAAGAALTNQTIGGDGVDPDAAARTWTAERRAAQSVATAEMNRSRAGTSWTEERKKLQSEAQKRRWASEQERAAARVRMTKVTSDPAYRAKQSASVAAAWSDERRTRQSRVAKAVNSAPGRRERQSALAAALKKDGSGRFMRDGE